MSNKSMDKEDVVYIYDGILLSQKLLEWRFGSLHQVGWHHQFNQCTWLWADSGTWWRTGEPGMLHSVRSQRVRQDWATEQHQVKNHDQVLDEGQETTAVEGRCYKYHHNLVSSYRNEDCKYSHPLVCAGEWFLDPRGYQNPRMLKSLIWNGTAPSTLCVHGSTSTDSTNLGLKFSPWLVESMDAKQTVDTDGVTVFIGKNKTVYKWTYIVQTHVIQGSIIFSFYFIINMFVCIYTYIKQISLDFFSL